jgi:hypothetical protein
MKYFFGILCGSLVGVLLAFAIEHLAHNLYPLPNDTSKDELAVLEAWIQEISPIVFFIIIIAHAVGTFCAALIAVLISHKKPWLMGSVISSIFFVFGILNVLMIKHPLWFIVADLIIYFPAGLSAVYISFRLKNVV